MLYQFDELYEKAYPISCVNDKSTEEWKAFSTKKGKGVRVVCLQDHLNDLPIVDEYFKFFREAGSFYLIPCDNPNGDINGYIMRAIGKKEYFAVFEKDTAQPTFGWSEFSGFKKGEPIVITEGIKDCLYLKKLHPYVIATLSCRISKELCEFLSVLTDKVVLAFDNDFDSRQNVGQVATKKAITQLSEFGIRASKILPDDGLKDFGQHFSLDRESSSLIQRFNLALCQR